MLKIAGELQTGKLNVDLQPCGESTSATLSYLSGSGCKLSMTTKISENIASASTREDEFWLKLAKAQLCINSIFAIKQGADITLYGFPFTGKCEPSNLGTITLSDDISKSYPDAKLRKAVIHNLIKVSL